MEEPETNFLSKMVDPTAEPNFNHARKSSDRSDDDLRKSSIKADDKSRQRERSDKIPTDLDSKSTLIIANIKPRELD